MKFCTAKSEPDEVKSITICRTRILLMNSSTQTHLISKEVEGSPVPLYQET